MFFKFTLWESFGKFGMTIYQWLVVHIITMFINRHTTRKMRYDHTYRKLLIHYNQNFTASVKLFQENVELSHQMKRISRPCAHYFFKFNPVPPIHASTSPGLIRQPDIHLDTATHPYELHLVYINTHYSATPSLTPQTVIKMNANRFHAFLFTQRNRNFEYLESGTQPSIYDRLFSLLEQVYSINSSVLRYSETTLSASMHFGFQAL